jgi:hypothetical protein
MITITGRAKVGSNNRRDEIGLRGVARRIFSRWNAFTVGGTVLGVLLLALGLYWCRGHPGAALGYAPCVTPRAAQKRPEPWSIAATNAPNRDVA